MDKFPLTKTGFAMLEQELKRRKGTDRPSIIGDIAEYLAPSGKRSYEILQVKWL
ncbi:MAG: hypothetical protein IJ218_03135 [Alphaproteobacteria bacterium]|nr:hypothetical protein [Alphaproteobacteria bacterium]